jgi:hypothetical protein
MAETYCNDHVQSFPNDVGTYSTSASGPSSAYCISVMAARTALQARLTMCGKHLNQVDQGIKMV